MAIPYAAQRPREPETGPVCPEQVHIESAGVVLARNTGVVLARNTGGKNRHVVHVPLDRIGEIEAPAAPTRPGQGATPRPASASSSVDVP